MRYFRGGTFLCFIFSFINIPSAYCDAIKTVEEYLAEQHVQTDKQSLIRALRKGPGELRVAVAQYVAEHNIQEAIPAIEMALHDETDPDFAVPLARSLGTLKDPLGVRYLTSLCQDSSAMDIMRVRASIAEEEGLKEHGCSEILRHLARYGDESTKIEALSFFGRLVVTGDQRDELLSIARRDIDDLDPLVRYAAFQALVSMKAPNALSLLRAAADSETDPVKTLLQSLLDGALRAAAEPGQRPK